MEYLRMSGYETRFEKDQDAEPNMIGAEYSGRGTHIEVGCEASRATVDIHENIFGEIESITIRVEDGDEKAEIYLSNKLAPGSLWGLWRSFWPGKQGSRRRSS